MRQPTQKEIEVAKAIFEATLWPEAWKRANDVEKDQALFKARAAIRAMIPATPEMLQATRTKSVNHVVENYNAMLEAASPQEDEK